MVGLTLRSTSPRRMASTTIGPASFFAPIRTDSPAARMPMPLPCRPDWFLTSARAAGIRSSTVFGGLKYDGQRGAGYFFPPLAPARAVAPALSDRSARLQAPATPAAAIIETARIRPLAEAYFMMRLLLRGFSDLKTAR